VGGGNEAGWRAGMAQLLSPRVVALIRAGAQTFAVNAIGGRFYGAREIVHGNFACGKVAAELSRFTRAEKFGKTFQALVNEFHRNPRAALDAACLIPRGDRTKYVNAHSECRKQPSILTVVCCVSCLSQLRLSFGVCSEVNRRLGYVAQLTVARRRVSLRVRPRMGASTG
jgi:hypothetical protein